MAHRKWSSLAFTFIMALVGSNVPILAQQTNPVYGPQPSQAGRNVTQPAGPRSQQKRPRQPGMQQTQPPRRAAPATAPPTRQKLLVQQAPFRLGAAEQQRVDQILDNWERRSQAVRTYSARFARWEYDPVFGPNDPKLARTLGHGMIRYASPDKGEFQLETLGQYTPPQQEGAPPQFPQQKVEFDEHWICDGKSVFELNSKQKQLIETKLPPEMQGKQIADGPLPFMFGATKQKLKARYWIREIKPPAGQNQVFWLEVYPRRPGDAANFSRVWVSLDQQFLPVGLQIFSPNFDPRKNWSRTVYQFTERQVNNPIHRGRQFMNLFISPKPPLGWKKVVSNYGQPAGQPPRATATKPKNPSQPSGQKR